MHEMSLAEGILKIALEYAEDNEAKKVEEIGLLIGEMSGVVVDSLDFGFKMLAKGTKTGVEGHPIKIMLPILHMSKADIVRTGKKLGAPLELTWSCYNGGARACGHCDSCRLRLEGFRQAGYRDEIPYEDGVQQ